MPRSEERFAGRMSNAERISYYYGAPGKPLVCVTCGSKELVLALPPQCAPCLKEASASETLKRLPVIPADPAISDSAKDHSRVGNKQFCHRCWVSCSDWVSEILVTIERRENHG